MEDDHGHVERRGTSRTYPGRTGRQPDAGADPGRLQRRVPADPADRTAEEGRGAHERAGRRLRQEERPAAPALLPDRRRHGDGLRRHERGLRPALRRLAGRGEERRPRPGARRRTEGPVHHGRAHALPARRYAARRLRARPRGGRQGGLESRPGRQATDPRRPEVSQLVQGDLSRQRHQGGADQRLAVGGSARLVLDQRHEARRAHAGEPGGGLPALPLARHLHAGLSRLDGRGRSRHRHPEAQFVEGLHGRRQHQQGSGARIPGAWTTRSWSIPSTKRS